MLIIDPAVPRFTRLEQVEELNAQFGGFRDGTFRRWQEHGLAAAPGQDGRWRKGHAGSSEGLWSEHDRRMLTALLGQREKHRLDGQGQLSLASLTTLVVWAWVGWDDIVALEQAQRALGTWAQYEVAGPYGKARSMSRLRKQTREMVASVAAPGTSRADQNAVSDMLIEKL